MTKKKEPDKKQDIPRYCLECGKEILPGEAFEHIETKRHTKIDVHRRCLQKARL